MHEVRIPNLGAQIDDAEITEWLASEGARVEADEVITILETEKAAMTWRPATAVSCISSPKSQMIEFPSGN